MIGTLYIYSWSWTKGSCDASSRPGEEAQTLAEIENSNCGERSFLFRRNKRDLAGLGRTSLSVRSRNDVDCQLVSPLFHFSQQSSPRSPGCLYTAVCTLPTATRAETDAWKARGMILRFYTLDFKLRRLNDEEGILTTVKPREGTHTSSALKGGRKLMRV